MLVSRYTKHTEVSNYIYGLLFRGLILMKKKII